MKQQGITKRPIGIDDFEKIRTEKFYYVDKTAFIKDLLINWGEVNLFTRPRRFGKTLNMSMLKYFFEYGCASQLFDGLEISQEQQLCDEYMGKFPVIFVTLKDVDARNFQSALNTLRTIIGMEARRFSFLKESDQITQDDRESYLQLIETDATGQQVFAMSDEALKNSLFILSQLLCKHYGQKVILLIDEYDVPLDKAQQNGYYDEMVSLIRNLFSRVLKTNSSLQFAVLTGCLRIAKESIFTGLNNLNVLSITSKYFNEYFGFTDREVRGMLDFYGLGNKYETVRTWYDGYRFGNAEVYCPWDVINYVNLLCVDPEEPPHAFWMNSSGNEIIRMFLRKASPATRREIEKLINGESVAKKVNQELTYRELYDSLDNLWSVLFMTGYLTQRGTEENGMLQLAIPNLEIRKIFAEQILEWFQEDSRRDSAKLAAFCAAFPAGDAAAVEAQFNAYLAKTISIRDTSVRRGKKENFYHGILLGLLSSREDWLVESNAESGEGYCDILVELLEEEIGIVIEIKYAESGDLQAGCEKALEQIEDRGYESRLVEDGMNKIWKYGIACNRKRCKVEVQNRSEKQKW